MPRRRPPWWPEDEAWPPTRPPGSLAWRRARRGFFMPFALAFLFLIIAGSTVLTFVISAVAHVLGLVAEPSAPMPNPLVGVIGIVILVAGLSLLLRTVRHVALPLGDLMSAASRVAEGDYSTRVVESGSSQVRDLARAFNSMSARLQESDENRRNLLADVTHEMRTPLTIIQGNLEGLIDGVYPRDDAHLQPILEETRVLSRLIDDLRTLALAESGALKLQKETTDLGLLINETVASFRAQADAAEVEISSEASSEVKVNVDPARVRQVLDNLVVNALKYTPAGGTIRLRAWTEGAHAFITVSDTGRGIAATDLSHIFDRFYKSRDSRGSGLGLAIAKNLVAAHQGEITAESELGKGTTIRFWLPIQK